MANHKSAEKRNRQNKKRRTNNKWKTSRVRTEVKKLRTAITEKNGEKAKELLNTVQSLFDKLAKTSAITRKTASRKVGRLASQVTKL